MRSSTIPWAVALLAALTQAACVTAPMNDGVSAAAASLKLFSDPGFDCPNVHIGDVHFCRIPVTLAVTGNVCTARVASPVTFRSTVNGTRRDRLIVWNLVPPANTNGQTFAFQKDYGVIVTRNPPQGPAQLYDLLIGDGVSNDNLHFRALNRQDWGNDSGSVYFPIVIMTDSSSGTAVESVCAVLDPKIVNSN